MAKKIVGFIKSKLLWFLLSLVSCSGAQKTTLPQTVESAKDTTVNVLVKEKPKKEAELPDSLSLRYPLNRKDTYDILYCLPLFLNEYPNLNPKNERFANIALDYWWGAKLAFDTLSDIGLTAKVHLIDTRNDTAIIQAEFDKLKKNPDLIFGPLFPSNVAYLAPYAAQNMVNIISPFASIDQFKDYNDRTFFSRAPVNELNEAVSDFISENYASNYPIVIFCRAVSFELEEAQRILNALPKNLAEKAKIEEVDKNYIDKDYLKYKLPDSAVVVICSERESFVTSIIAELRRSLNPYKVIGKESWLEFQSIDPQAWERLSMHFVASSYIDYTNEMLAKFIIKYRHIYNAEPSKYAIAGYFETIYYGLYLELYGTNFQRFINELDIDLPYAQINFEQEKKHHAFYNNQVKFLTFKKHQLVEVE